MSIEDRSAGRVELRCWLIRFRLIAGTLKTRESLLRIIVRRDVAHGAHEPAAFIALDEPGTDHVDADRDAISVRCDAHRNHARADDDPAGSLAAVGDRVFDAVDLDHEIRSLMLESLSR